MEYFCLPQGCKIQPVIAGDIDHHAIVSRFNTLRQLIAKTLKIHIDVHVGEDGAAWCHPLDPAQRVIKVEVAWMRRAP
jgi:hypothetical protein